MGYRSDVRVLLPEAEFNAMDAKLKALGKDEYLGYEIKKYRSEDAESVKKFTPGKEPVKYVYFGWDWIKWYEGDKTVDIVMDAVLESENCHYVRFGEDSSDFEEIYNLDGYVDCIEYPRGFNDNDNSETGTAKFAVLMNSSYVRDSQMFDPAGLSEEEFNQIDLHGEESEGRWHDMEPVPFIAIVEAKTETEACGKAAEQYRYDARCLFAEKITTAGTPAKNK